MKNKKPASKFIFCFLFILQNAPNHKSVRITKIHRLEENLGAMEVELTEQEMAAINQALDNLDIDETHF